jgi:hypothetical protein
MRYSMTTESCGYTGKLASCWNRDSEPTRQMLCQFTCGGSVPLCSLRYLKVGCAMVCSLQLVCSPVWMGNFRSQDVNQALKRNSFLRNGNRALISSGSEVLPAVIMKFTYLSIYLSMALQSFCWNQIAFFSFLILYTVSRTPWMGDQHVARPLPTHRINAHRHLCLEWDSNPRFQRSRERRQFMP